MLTIFLILAISVFEDAELPQTELLKTFRAEFVEIEPGETGPAEFVYQGKHKVRLKQSFAIAKYEVPQNLWQTVMGENPSRWKGERNSVEMLSFTDAIAFCNKTTNLMREAKLIRDDQFIRLPTEVEWEYAARAGTTSKYSFGDDAEQLGEFGWFNGNAAGNDPPVGAKKSNPWGLYDVHGYLWEWCVKSDEKSLQESFINEAGWQKLAIGKQQALRGGSWKDKAPKLTSAFRNLVDADAADDAVGLRCVLVSINANENQAAGEFKPTAQQDIVADDAKPKLLWCEGEFTEGPAAAPDGSILFSDIGNRILKYDPVAGKVTTFREPSGRSNGLIFDREGNLFACEGANTGGGRRISMTKPGGQPQTLSDGFGGKRFNSPNDLAIDALGRVYFTDPRYVGDEPRELDFEGVFIVLPDGTTRIATSEVTKPNGILVSRDGSQLFVAENNPSGDKHLLKFDVQQDGTLKQKKVLFDFGEGRGIDGMAMDTAGNIYATAGQDERSGVYVFSPDGKPLALIKMPGAPTNCTFGTGKLANTLFVTAAAPAAAKTKGPYGIYEIQLKQTGLHFSK